MNQVFVILIIVILGPVIGSLLGVIKKPSEKYISNMLSFAAGVMLAIAFFDLMPESIKHSSGFLCASSIILGMFVMYLLDFLMPHIDFFSSLNAQENKYNKRTISLLILGIVMHNFPEGMAIGISSVSTFKLSVPIALALAVHDIPESICASVPCYYLSKKRIKAFLISISTTIPTLLGFSLTFYIFKNISLVVLGILLGATAGVMLYISIFELIPMAFAKKKDNSTVIISLIGGMMMVLLMLMFFI